MEPTNKMCAPRLFESLFVAKVVFWITIEFNSNLFPCFRVFLLLLFSFVNLEVAFKLANWVVTWRKKFSQSWWLGNLFRDWLIHCLRKVHNRGQFYKWIPSLREYVREKNQNLCNFITKDGRKPVKWKRPCIIPNSMF